MSKIHKLAFFEDLGGIKNVDEREIKPRLLYRSSDLSRIDEKSLNKIASKYKIKYCIDLRTEGEVAEKNEEFISPTIIRIHLPLVSNEDNPPVTKETRLSILEAIMAKEGGTRRHFEDFYRKLISSKNAISCYQQIFKLLLSTKGEEGVVYHCTQGKDRTGVVTILLLAALGVNEEKIRKVYLSFNNHGRLKRTGIWVAMSIVYSYKKANALNNMLVAKKTYIDTIYDEIKKYGGIDTYLKDIIKLSENDIMSLRLLYLK